MAKFRFRLEALLRLREVEEDRSKRKFFELLKIRQRMERELVEIVQTREETKSQCRSSSSGVTTLDMDEFLARQRYLNVLYKSLLAKREEINRFQPELEQAKVFLREAQKKRKTVEKLKERRQREFDLKEARNEIKELDEIGQVYGNHIAERILER